MRGFFVAIESAVLVIGGMWLAFYLAHLTRGLVGCEWITDKDLVFWWSFPLIATLSLGWASCVSIAMGHVAAHMDKEKKRSS